jgi:hypothetical protein
MNPSNRTRSAVKALAFELSRVNDFDSQNDPSYCWVTAQRIIRDLGPDYNHSPWNFCRFIRRDAYEMWAENGKPEGDSGLRYYTKAWHRSISRGYHRSRARDSSRKAVVYFYDPGKYVNPRRLISLTAESLTSQGEMHFRTGPTCLNGTINRQVGGTHFYFVAMEDPRRDFERLCLAVHCLNEQDVLWRADEHVLRSFEEGTDYWFNHVPFEPSDVSSALLNDLWC